MQFAGVVKQWDADEGVGTIVREPDRQEIVVLTRGLALGVDTLHEGDRVQFDVDTGTDWQARNVMRV